MRRAVAFCQVIEVSKGAKTHKVSSKNIAGMFQAVVEAYQATEEDDAASTLACEAEHVDGSMNASEKEEKLVWLKAEPADHLQRVAAQGDMRPMAASKEAMEDLKGILAGRAAFDDLIQRSRVGKISPDDVQKIKAFIQGTADAIRPKN